jgi:very-short-patch-repair endonuclease
MEKNKKEAIITEKFIEMSKKVHGDKFDYSEAVYVNAKTKVKLTCKNGHKIEVTYRSHVKQQSNCVYCVRDKSGIEQKTKARDTFVEKSRVIHGNKYNYDKVNYVDSHTKIIIICNEGHEFEQQPTRHLSGQGCKYCNEKAIKNSEPITNVVVPRITNKWTTEKFIEKAKEIHGDKFDYSMVNFISYKKKVVIKCLKEHIFEQAPDGHLRGNDCKQCQDLKNFFRKITNEEFIEKSKQIFINMFDYSKCYYIGSNIKVTLICKEKNHEFEVEPRHHYNSLGCPLCNKTTEGKMEKELRQKYPNLKLQFFIKNINMIKTYPFDFFIKKHNIIVELDGKQHFETVEFFQQTVEERQLIDFIKMYWAFKEGYTIIRVYQPDVYKDNFNWVGELVKNIKDYDKPEFICLAKDIKVYDEYCNNYKKFLENYNF